MAAAGSAVITEIIHTHVKKVKWAWTSDASGNVSGGAGLTTKIYTGKIIGLATDPGATAPTDNYDVSILDADGIDVLFGGGIDRDTANNEYVQGSSLGAVVESTLELVIANAGNAKQGTVYLFIQ
jgi:hypothetical protein